MKKSKLSLQKEKNYKDAETEEWFNDFIPLIKTKKYIFWFFSFGYLTKKEDIFAPDWQVGGRRPIQNP